MTIIISGPACLRTVLLSQVCLYFAFMEQRKLPVCLAEGREKLHTAALMSLQTVILQFEWMKMNLLSFKWFIGRKWQAQITWIIHSRWSKWGKKESTIAKRKKEQQNRKKRRKSDYWRKIIRRRRRISDESGMNVY